jgi:hypothetical protein
VAGLVKLATRLNLAPSLRMSGPYAIRRAQSNLPLLYSQDFMLLAKQTYQKDVAAYYCYHYYYYYYYYYFKVFLLII